MTLTRADLRRLAPGDLARLEEIVSEQVALREMGRVPWLCRVPDCDGRPHPGRNGAHSRAVQRPPAEDVQWDTWLLLAGRGFGKTRTGAEWVWRMAKDHPGSRGALIGPTAADTRDVLVQGESGIIACAPPAFRPVYEPSKRLLTYPNGSTQHLYSAAEPDRLRGPQHHYLWADELAAWKDLQYCWDMAQMGLRLGEHPRACVTTTPRPLPLIKALLKDEMTAVVRGSTYDNLHNLAPTFARAVVSRYEGTTLGRQELDAEVLDDMPGAMVARRHIENNRVTVAPEMVNIVIGMDPAGTGTGDETGLVVVGRGTDGKNYVLEDASGRMSPDQSSRRAWALHEQYGASLVVVEDNGGKDWIEMGLRMAWKELRPGGGPPPLRRVNASQGKRLRAQPVAMRYEQGRVCHVGVHEELETQLTTWIPEEDPHASPDRLDAMVHGVAHLMKKHDRDTSAVAAPHLMRRSGGAGEHPMMAARRRAQAAKADVARKPCANELCGYTTSLGSAYCCAPCAHAAENRYEIHAHSDRCTDAQAAKAG